MKKAIKKATIILLVALLVTHMISIASASNGKTLGGKKSELVLQIPYGNSEATTKVLGSTEKKEEIVGAKSFSVGNDGSVYILDTCNYRVIHYSEKGIVEKTISIPQPLWGLDIEICNNNLYLLCDDYCIYYTMMNQAAPVWTKIGEVEPTSISGLYREDGIVYGRAWDGNEVYVTSQKTIADCQKVCLGYDEETSKGFINKGGRTYSLSFQAEPIGAYIIKQAGNTAFILEQEALLRFNPYVEKRIVKYENENIVSTAIMLPIDKCLFIPYKSAYISDQGRVYQLYPDNDSLKVYELFWEEGEKTNITLEMIERDSFNPNQIKNRAMNQGQRTYATRSQALSRAYDMVTYAWYYNASIHHTPNSGTTASPNHLGANTSGYQTGIPYCHGGMNGIDTATYSGSTLQNMKNFSDALSGGQTAGNVNTSAPWFVYSTAGLDCTGFISAAYLFNSKLGSNIPNIFTQTTWADAVPGDVADSPTHAFMLKYKYNNGVGNYLMSTYESVTSGSKQATILNYHNYDEVVSIYNIYGID